MAKFSNSTTDESSRSVTLETDWGNFSKYCEHGDYAPGKSFCQWLIQNTSTEFAEVNFRRAFTCLRGPVGYGEIKGPLFDSFNGEVHSLEVKHADEDIEVTLKFSDRSNDHPPRLTITARRWDTD